jgi:hypothetical protein
MLSYLYNKVLIMTLFKNFFNTAPRTKGKKVTDLEKAGKSSLLLDAVEAERDLRKGVQDGKSSKIIVKRVGAHS